MQNINYFYCFHFLKDLLYNPKAKSGFIYNKIKNTKGRFTKLTNELSEEDLKKFLKHCVVSKDRVQLKEKLLDSVALRRRLLKDDDVEFRDFFKFYFVDPSLVRKINSFYISTIYSNIVLNFFIRSCMTSQLHSTQSTLNHYAVNGRVLWIKLMKYRVL